MSNGVLKAAFLAHLVPDPQTPWLMPPLSLDELTEQDFSYLVEKWDREIAEAGDETFFSQEIDSDQDRML